MASITWNEFVEHLDDLGYVGEQDDIRAVKAFLRAQKKDPSSIQCASGITVNVDRLFEDRHSDDEALDRRVQGRIEELERTYGPLGNGSQSGEKVNPHSHRVEINAASRRTAASEEKLFEQRGWRYVVDPPREDITPDSMDTGGFGESDDCRDPFCDFLRAIVNTKRGRYDKRLEKYDLSIKQQQGESIDSEGGFLTPAFHPRLSFRNPRCRRDRAQAHRGLRSRGCCLVSSLRTDMEALSRMRPVSTTAEIGWIAALVCD